MKSVAKGRGRFEDPRGEDGLCEGSPKGRAQPWSPKGRDGYGRGGSGGRDIVDLRLERNDRSGEGVVRISVRWIARIGANEV
jgi:hypothetical protein